MDLNADHGAIAWSHFTAQFQNSRRLQAVVESLHPQSTNDMLIGLYNNRWLDTAVGKQLDGIGEIVGIGRNIENAFANVFFGFESQPNSDTFSKARIRRRGESDVGGSALLNDEEYRKVLYWKIAINNGHGTAAEIASAIKVIFDAGWCIVSDIGNAKIRVIFNVTAQTIPAFLTQPENWIPRAAGVGLELSIVDIEKVFGFREQGFYGFGEGVILQGF